MATLAGTSAVVADTFVAVAAAVAVEFFADVFVVAAAIFATEINPFCKKKYFSLQIFRSSERTMA